MEETEARAMVEERRKGASYKELAAKYGIASEEARIICENAADKPIDAGLRYRPVLERAPNTREGWIAEMEQSHDGEWVHISNLNPEVRNDG
jgi:hypothetical protein